MIIENLSFKFNRSEQYFFKNVTVQFAPNTINFIQGDNGVGKSTFFNILQGETDKNVLLDAKIALDGIVYAACNNRLPQSFIDQVHTVQQDYNTMIADKFTFMENLQLANLPQYPHVCRLPEATLFDVVKLFDIDLHKPAYLLSGGQRQLLAILMALQKQTKLLLLDEPTATLDTKNGQLIIETLYKLAEQLGITIIIICHDKELIERYAQDHSFMMIKLEHGERILERFRKK